MGGYVEHDVDSTSDGYEYIYEEDGVKLLQEPTTFRDCYGACLSFVQNPIGVDVVIDTNQLWISTFCRPVCKEKYQRIVRVQRF